jgi:hypothetical protein
LLEEKEAGGGDTSVVVERGAVCEWCEVVAGPSSHPWTATIEELVLGLSVKTNRHRSYRRLGGNGSTVGGTESGACQEDEGPQE